MARRGGFLLIDVLVAVALTGLAIASCMYLMGTSSNTNAHVGELSRAMAIANSAMNHIASYPLVDPTGDYGSTGTPNDISDFGNRLFNPAIDSNGSPLAGAAGWSQRVKVQSFDLDAPGTVTAPHGSNARLVTVSALYDGKSVYTVQRVFAPTISVTP